MHPAEHSHPHTQLRFSTSEGLSEDLFFRHFGPSKSSFLVANYESVLDHEKKKKKKFDLNLRSWKPRLQLRLPGDNDEVL